MRLSVIIVNWNTAGMIYECVRSLVADQARCGLVDLEIIVVDNASSDGSMDAVVKEFPFIYPIWNAKNLGFARATNQGIKRSTGRYVLLLNPDTETYPGALDSMLRFIESHPGAGAIGAMLLNSDGSLQISAYPEPTLFREAWRMFYLDKLWALGSYDMKSWRADAAREVEVLTGACLLLRRDAINQCGLLDEDYFIYSEDQDLCRRLRSQGWRLFWLPEAQVKHCGGQSTRQVKAEMFVRLYREKIAYFRKHRGRLTASIYKILLFGASIARQSLSPIAFLSGKNRHGRAREIAKLYRQLIRELPGL